MNQVANTHAAATLVDGLLLACLGSLHRCYVRSMTGFARYQTSRRSTPVSLEFEALDAAADQAGAIYRGLGVGIGLLSIAILFLALAPVALGLTDKPVMVVVKTAKVALMLTVVLAVMMAVFGPWRERWTELRKAAQALGWGPQGAGFSSRETQAEPAATQANDYDGLRRLVDEQIGYNAMTAGRYHHVERNTMYLTYFFFLVALSCAAVDTFSYLRTGSSPKWLLFGTVFLPGVVGILHGVNGFLCVGEQSFSCRLMEKHLTQLRATLDRLQELGAMPRQEDALAEVRKEIMEVLTRHDDLWAKAVKIPTV